MVIDHLPPGLADWRAPLEVSLAVAALAVTVAFVLRRLAQRAAPVDSASAAVVRNIGVPLLVVTPVLAFTLALHGADDALADVARVRHVCWLVTTALLTWLAVRALGGVEDAVLARYPIDGSENLEARRIHTQARILTRTAMGAAILLGVGVALMSFEHIRQIGASLLASAGVLGIVAGLAARPVLGNLIAGLQIGLSQPMRLDDAVIVDGEWGRIEEITGTYVVVHLWDERRMVVPLQWWIEHPFQNWTRQSSNLIGTVLWWVDYRAPLEAMRHELHRLCAAAPEWDGRVCALQVVETSERAMQVRALVSASDAGRTWDLRCKVREGVVAWMVAHAPQSLPTVRLDDPSEPTSRAARTDR